MPSFKTRKKKEKHRKRFYTVTYTVIITRFSFQHTNYSASKTGIIINVGLNRSLIFSKKRAHAILKYILPFKTISTQM